MLVLSRRPQDKIVFPHLGISIYVVRVEGNVVRVGIDAPKEVAVLRGEIAPPAEAAPANSARTTHALRNQINKLSLRAHIIQRQLEIGDLDAAQTRMEELLNEFQKLDAQFAGRTRSRQSKADRKSSLCRALVVEDDANERELLAGLLAMHGCECAMAEDGLAALDHLEAGKDTDFVLLDMRMPRFGGRETVERIRGDTRFNKLKVFAISGTSQDEMGVATGADGVDAWFRKPLDPRKLWKTMQNHLGEVPVN